MKRKILRQIAKTRMQQEGINPHNLFKRRVKNSKSSSEKKDDQTLFGERWREYAKKGVISVLTKLPRRRRIA